MKGQRIPFLSEVSVQILVGRSVSPGYARGSAVLFDRAAEVEIPRYNIDDSQVSQELSRFHEALERSCRDLRQLENRVLAELGDVQSSIFSAHLGLLQDKEFVERIQQRIRTRQINVEQALDVEVVELARLLGTLESEYLRERAQDIRDIGARLMRQLARGDVDAPAELPPNSVIVARELFPSETIDLDRKQVAAIITEEGGENSHAAILARALGIPAVTAIEGAMDRIPPGCRLLVDGQAGQVTLSPNQAASDAFAVSRIRYEDDSVQAAQTESLPCVTLDGKQITLLANLNRPCEVDLVHRHHLRGVGLFRTEFLFIDCWEPPSYERQLQTYRQLIEDLGDFPLTVRTLDLGGDKLPLFLEAQKETNPYLGLRGLRFSLAHRDLFEPQLRALLTALGDHDLRLLFPMVLGESDLREGIMMVESIASELGLGWLPKIGAMIETPSSLFALDEILKLVDFVSIGSNDLTQFMLAADRNAADLADEYSVLHPSVLRAIAAVADAGLKANREVCVCGEAAGDPATAGIFIGLGITNLSMSPVRAARVGMQLRNQSYDRLVELARQALQSASIGETKQLLMQFGGSLCDSR